MQIVTVVSACGGVGRSTIVATLADMIRRRGRPVLAIDFDPANALALHLGAKAYPPRGIAGASPDAGESSGDGDWPTAALINSDGVQFLPWGLSDERQLQHFQTRLIANPQWLRLQLRRVQLPTATIVLVDTPRLPSPLATHAVHAADRVLGVLAPDAASYAALDVMTRLRPEQTRYVVNGLEPNRPLQNDIRLMLRDDLGARLVSIALHRDGSLSDAQARNRALADDAPHSQAVQDFQLLTSWLLSELDSATS